MNLMLRMKLERNLELLKGLVKGRFINVLYPPDAWVKTHGGGQSEMLVDVEQVEKWEVALREQNIQVDWGWVMDCMNKAWRKSQ